MQKKKSVLIVFLLLLFLIFNQASKKHTTLKSNKNPQTVVKSNIENSISNKLKNHRNSEKKQYNPLAGYDKKTDKTPVISYVAAFREFQKFKRCREIIQSLENNKDPYQEFLNYMNKSRSQANFFNLTPIQHQQFDIKTEICQNMQSFAGEKYTAGHERYRKRFYQAKPKTKEDKDLAQSWPLKEGLAHLNFIQNELKKGYKLSNKVLQIKINNRIKYYQGMLNYINLNDDIEFSLRTQIEISMYQNHIADLTDIVDGVTQVDEQYLAHLDAAYLIKMQEIDVFLKQNKSADAFITLAAIYFRDKGQELGFNDTSYFKSLSTPIYQLVSCAMGAPCGSDSKDIFYRCFQQRQPDETACGVSVEQYYLNHYFSPNQLIDVNLLINYFMDNYAKI